MMIGWYLAGIVTGLVPWVVLLLWGAHLASADDADRMRRHGG